jgi:glutathione S-transferase
VPGVNELLAPFTRLQAWEERVANLGEGTRLECTAEEAFAVARSSRPAPCACVDDEALDLSFGKRVEVAPDDTRRGAVSGRLVALDWNEIGVAREHAQCGEVVVHFPRLGYRVTPLD